MACSNASASYWSQSSSCFKVLANGHVDLQRSESNQSKDSEYDENKFLQTAIGDELLRTDSLEDPPTASIDTDDVSELLSSKSTLILSRRRKHKTRKFIKTITSSYYEEAPFIYKNNLQKPGNETTTPDLVHEHVRHSYATYEDVTNLGIEIFSNEGKKKIKNQIFINENIIDQTEKMLNYGLRKTVNFIGSHMHLEGEGILLLSKMRRQVLINYLYRIPEGIPEAVAKITIENLRCILNTSEGTLPIGQHYYIGILQHKTTVYSTRIAAANKLGWFDLGGFFIFENVGNTFSIKIQLYCINVPERSQMCFPLPFFKCSSKLPKMELVGEVHIGMLNIKNKTFTLKNTDSINSMEHKLTASIEAIMKWPDCIKSFLTIGTGKLDQQPVWNRRWCVLEDARLKYFSHPSDENFGSPVGTIDLQSCKSCDEAETKYLFKKTLCLFLDDGVEFKRVLFTTDTIKEYDLWLKHFQIILRLIKEWNILKKNRCASNL